MAFYNFALHAYLVYLHTYNIPFVTHMCVKIQKKIKEDQVWGTLQYNSALKSAKRVPKIREITAKKNSKENNNNDN